jgi:hypothetical protein
MRTRRVLGAIIVFAFCWLLIAWVSHVTAHRPGLSLAVEPSGIADDDGREMLLGILTISNSANGERSRNLIYVDERGPVQAKVANGFVSVNAMLGACHLGPGEKCQRMFLLPLDTKSCKVSLKYVDATVLFEGGRFATFAGWLPPGTRVYIPKYFYRWLGNYSYMPGRNWKELNVDLLVAPSPAEN